MTLPCRLPAMLHHFNSQLRCESCGTNWEQHQATPLPCPNPIPHLTGNRRTPLVRFYTAHNITREELLLASNVSSTAMSKISTNSKIDPHKRRHVWRTLVSLARAKKEPTKELANQKESAK